MATTDRLAPGADAVPGWRYRFADVEFDELEGELRVAGQKVTIEPRPLRLLAELLRHANEVVSKEELLDTVWEGRPTVDHVLANAISKLRTALGDTGTARLLTVPRVGYRLLGPVQRLAARAPELSLAAGQPVPGREGYVLDRVLGGGEHGDVWLARHAKLGQQRVFKFATDGARLSALKREYTLFRLLRQELGPRDDFAVVVDANFASAPYFLECEWGGDSLLGWAAEPGRLSAMDTAARVALFLQIARAVAAAHGIGVLHKDLKPSNVLVSGEPGAWQARLTDFGSGRLLDPARLDALKVTAVGLTQTQAAASDSRSGTLMYLAPELLNRQAATVQSDVYALGLILYQLLVGDFTRPLASGWERDVADPLLREDIAAAADGRPQSRLQSAAELADRLSRLAERHAERARALEQAAANAAAESAARQARARRPWVLALVATLGIGLASSVWLQREASAARDRSQAEAQRTRQVTDFLTQDVLQAADISTAGPRKTMLLPEVLASASTKAGRRLQGSPGVEGEIRLHLGELLFRLGAHQAAAAEFEAAARLLESAGTPVTAALHLQARYAWARALTAQSRLDEAAAQLSAADSKAADLSPGGGPVATLAQARAKSVYLGMRQDYPAALAMAKAAVALGDATDPQDLSARFVMRRQLAEILLRVGQFDEAEAALQELASPVFGADAVGEVVTARAQVTWARLRMAQGRAAESEAPLRTAIDAMSRRLGPNDLANGGLYEELGRVLTTLSRFDEAERAYRQAQAVFVANGGPDHQGARVNLLNAALVGMEAGRSADALRTLDEGRPWFVTNMGGNRSPVVQLIDFYRARAGLDIGRLDIAQALMRGFDPDALAQATAAPWADVLQAERARLQLLSQPGSAQARAARLQLQDAVQRLADAPSERHSLHRYRKLL